MILLKVYNAYFENTIIQMWEYALIPFILIIIFLFSTRIKNLNIKKRPEYKYYVLGLFTKIAGGIALAFIYLNYYGYGDTNAYYDSCYAFTNLFYKNPEHFFTVLLSPADIKYMTYFDNTTGWPLWYLYSDPQTLTIIRLVTPIVLISFKSFVLATIMVAWVSYIGIWKAYLLFCDYFKGMSFQLAIAFLFIPSVIFWGSAILKDTFTLSATCWFVYAFHNLVFVRKKKVLNFVFAAVALYLIISLKPYIFMVLLPSVLMWVFIDRIRRFKNQLVVFLFIPLVYFGSIGGGFVVFSALGSALDEYSLDNILNKAIVTQQDMKKEYYQGSSFDIGTFDASAASIGAVAPKAVVAALYRPFLWEARNPVMFISAVESSLFLLLTLFVLLKVNIRRVIKYIFSNPILLFSVSFSLLFAFSVGLTSSNFGALVRFKIPLLPFFVASLFITLHLYKKQKLERFLKLFPEQDRDKY